MNYAQKELLRVQARLKKARCKARKLERLDAYWGREVALIEARERPDMEQAG